MIQHQRTMKYITLHIILLFQRQMVSAFVPFPSMIHHNYALMIGRIEGWNAYTPNSFPILMSVRTSFKHESGDNFEQNKSDTSKFETRGKEWIVLVDDEESIRNAVGNFLFDAGYVVTACSDAETLLELLSSASSVSWKKE